MPLQRKGSWERFGPLLGSSWMGARWRAVGDGAVRGPMGDGAGSGGGEQD